VGRNLPANAGHPGDAGSILGSGRSSGGRLVTHSSILSWEVYGQRSLAGYSPWVHKDSDTTEHI